MSCLQLKVIPFTYALESVRTKFICEKHRSKIIVAQTREFISLTHKQMEVGSSELIWWPCFTKSSKVTCFSTHCLLWVWPLPSSSKMVAWALVITSKVQAIGWRKGLKMEKRYAPAVFHIRFPRAVTWHFGLHLINLAQHRSHCHSINSLLYEDFAFSTK